MRDVGGTRMSIGIGRSSLGWSSIIIDREQRVDKGSTNCLMNPPVVFYVDLRIG